MKTDRRTLLKGMMATGVAAVVTTQLFQSQSFAQNKEDKMNSLKYFLDTHDRTHKTFPAKISPAEFEAFFAKYEKACFAEGVIPVRLHVGYAEGRAFCLNMAPDADAVKRAHDRVGLPYDTITEVQMASPSDTFFRRPA